jgi:uncharacterized protein (UPF0332 family)
MTKQQQALVQQARESLDAAKLLTDAGHHGFAAARAYYSMFYVAEAFLAGKDLSFSKHSGVIAAFAQHFTQTKVVPEEFHRHLIRGMEIRHVGDYDCPGSVSAEEARIQIARAQEFLELAERLLDQLPGPSQ